MKIRHPMTPRHPVRVEKMVNIRHGDEKRIPLHIYMKRWRIYGMDLKEGLLVFCSCTFRIYFRSRRGVKAWRPYALGVESRRGGLTL